MAERTNWKSIALDALRGASQGAVTGLLGGPVDLATIAMRPLGYDVEKPVAGSEWWRDRLQQAGAYQPRTGTPAEAIGEFGGAILAPGPDPMQYAALGLGGAAAIKAYHGSPHTFDRFDMSKIGTGEGAQAYGHGLYFAENPGVANQYQRNLANVTLDDKPVIELASQKHRLGIKDSPTVEQDIADYVSSYDGIKNARYTIANRRPELLKTFDEMVSGGRLKETGSTYTVNLDVDHDDLLDWDAPLSQQPEKVRKALEPLVAEHLSEFITTPERAATKATRWGDDSIYSTSVDELMGKLSGRGVYDRLANWTGGTTQATEALRAAGIPGIRYLDAGSRAGGEGSRNIVMFRDDLAEILERNGQPVAGKRP